MRSPRHRPILSQLYFPYQLHFHSLPYVDSSKLSIMSRRMLSSDSLFLKGVHLEVRSHSFREVGFLVFLPRNKIASALMSCLSSKEHWEVSLSECLSPLNILGDDRWQTLLIPFCRWRDSLHPWFLFEEDDMPWSACQFLHLFSSTTHLRRTIGKHPAPYFPLVFNPTFTSSVECQI